MTKKLFLAHQGDVLIREVKAIPEGAQPVEMEAGRHVLAHGEVTGHAHAIKTPRVRMFREDGSGGGGYLTVPSDGAAVTHEEHAKIALPPGIYEVVTQSQYTPAKIQRVVD